MGLQAGGKGLDGLRLSGDFQGWANLSEGNHHKLTLHGSRMGKNNVRIRGFQVAHVKDIQIDGSWGVFSMIAGAALRDLKSLQAAQKLAGAQRGGDFRHGVEESWCARHTINRFGFINRGNPEGASLIKTTEKISGGLQAAETGFDVASHGDASPQDGSAHPKVRKPRTSSMSYSPGALSLAQSAARSAPLAKVSRLEALCVSSSRSPSFAKITV